MTGRTTDVAIVGGGIIGMATALACARRGLSVVLSGEGRPGAASPAAAGMLAPSTEGAAKNVRAFANACRDAWPDFLDGLSEASAAGALLNQLGILELAAGADDVARLQSRCAGDSRWLEPSDVAALEPGVHAPFGAALHARDGAVDNEQLLAILDETIARTTGITWASGTRRLRLAVGSATIDLADGTAVVAAHVILAAGAWVGGLQGLPRPIPVVPVRGQMIGLRAATPLRHVVEGPGLYLVPRAGARLLVGSTMESVGFDAGTSPDAAATLALGAGRIFPAVASQTPAEHWSGLRPMTPDLLPILGPDPEHAALLYACGHSRNGILMTPLTASCLAALAAGASSPWPLEPFGIGRFE